MLFKWKLLFKLPFWHVFACSWLWVKTMPISLMLLHKIKPKREIKTNFVMLLFSLLKFFLKQAKLKWIQLETVLRDFNLEFGQIYKTKKNEKSANIGAIWLSFCKRNLFSLLLLTLFLALMNFFCYFKYLTWNNRACRQQFGRKLSWKKRLDFLKWVMNSV